MPRYRFQWTNISDQIVDELTSGEDLDGASPHDALRRWYGARPTPQLVADAWPALRDGWLVRDADARSLIVTELRRRGLGDTALSIETDAEALVYLQSCRNTKSLRQVVVDAFIDLGEAGSGNVTGARYQPATSTSRDGWESFTTELAASLDQLGEGQYLILSVRGTGVVREGRDQSAQYYVQFADEGAKGLRMEAVSNEYLLGDDQLDEHAMHRMDELGWRQPTYTHEQGSTAFGSPNYYREWARPVPHDEVAALAATTLRDVYTAPHPGFLTHHAFDTEGAPIELPLLRVDREPIPEVTDTKEAEAPPEPLGGRLETMMRELVEGEPSRTDAGEYLVGWGSAQIVVVPYEDPGFVRIWSPVLSAVVESAELLEFVHELNRQLRMIKVVWTGDTLVFAIDLFGMDLQISQLSSAIATVGDAADAFDEDLQERFGARPAPPGSAGYL